MTDPGKIKPSFGVTNLPAKEQKIRTHGPELLADKLVATLEVQGARLAWTRASICPCEGLNSQTKQPSPLCENCQGGGVFYFGPKDYAPPVEVGDLTDLQKIILEKGAAVIRGVIQRVTQAQDFYDVLGNWVRGTMMVTVRPENKIGYYDRLVNLDSEVSYSQIVTVPDLVLGLPPDIALRYPATSINIIKSETTRFEQSIDFVTENGQIKWVPGRQPAAGTRLSVHYLMHPTWIVIDHPHILRETQRHLRVTPMLTPLGSPTALPLQAAVRLEFLPPTDLPPAPAP